MTGNQQPLQGHSESSGLSVVPGTVRATSADKDEAVLRLNDAYGKGALTPEMLERRSDYVMQAEYTKDIKNVLLDLPQPPSPPAKPHSMTSVILKAALVFTAEILIMIGVPLAIMVGTGRTVTVSDGQGSTWLQQVHNGLETFTAVAGAVIGFMSIVATVFWLCAWYDGRSRVVPNSKGRDW
jgi:hypothetical protein